MSVHIRLQRHGNTHRPFYHVVAADTRAPRDGKFIERLGTYNPNTEPSEIKLHPERIQHWYGVGAQVSKAVDKLLKIEKVSLERNKPQKTKS